MKDDIANAFTVDVEDYFQVDALSRVISRDSWDGIETRVRRNTGVLLELLAERNIHGTFFVLGWVAKRHPELVREIAAAGHEIASHGMSHRLVYTQTPEVFREETRASKALLEDISGQPVIGYRAATYSITRQSMWALDILHEEGFRYDSSIFPVKHDRYGIPGAERVPHCLRTPSGYELVEFPLSTKQIGSYRLPIAGGGYFRLFPYLLTKTALRSINQRERMPFIFYLHPWEVDPDQPRVPASALSRFRHYNNLHRCLDRLRQLTTDFRFTTARNVLSTLGFLDAAAPSVAAAPTVLAMNNAGGA